MDRDTLWYEYKTRNSSKARETLINEYAYVVKYIVDRLNITTSASISHEDLLGHGIIGLIDAIERFDPNRGVKFETYAVSKVRGAVIDTLRKMDWVPRLLRSKSNAVKNAYVSLEARLGRPATDEEVAMEVGISIDDLNKIVSEMGVYVIMSLDDIIYRSGDDDNLTLGGVLKSEAAPGPATSVEFNEIKRTLATAIAALPAQERTVIGLYYYEGLTLKEIGKVLGVSEARISQVHSKAIIRLNGKLKRKEELFEAALQ